MRNWLIYEPAGGVRATLDDIERFVSVREGFSKAAFFFAPLWLVWRRCWLALALWAAALIAAIVLTTALDINGAPALLLIALPNLAVGFEAAWLRARALEARGYVLAGAAMARSREEAEAHFFVDWLDEARAAGTASAKPAASDAPYRPTPAGVLGLFPAPGAQR